MPRDTNGNYSLPSGTIVSSGDTILPSQHNPFANDIAQSMSNSLSRDGQGGMRAALDMGGFSIANALNGSFSGTFSAGATAVSSLNATGAISCSTLNTTSSITTGGSITASANITASNGQFVTQGTNAGVQMVDRTSGTSTPWTLYSDGGVLRFFNGSQRASLDVSGNFTARDLVANRGDGTGAVYLNSALTRSIFYDGSVYQLPNADLRINGNTAWTQGNLTNLNQLTNGPGYITGITSSMVTVALGYTPLKNTTDTISGSLTVNGSIFKDSQFYIEFYNNDSAIPSINFNPGVYIQYNRTAGKFYFAVGGAIVASLDGSGTLRVSGNVVQNTTP